MASASPERPAPQPKIKLYWLDDSRAQRFVWLLEELGLDYDVEIFQRNADRRAPPELQNIHPLGKSPIVRISLPDPADPARQKELVLAESGFIAQYLCEHFTQTKTLLPRRYRDGKEGKLGGETDEWMRCQYLLHYAEGSFFPPILVAIVLGSMSALSTGARFRGRTVLKSPRIPFFIRPVTARVVDKLFEAFVVPEVSKHLAFLESQLETSPGGGGYLCGAHLTAADILMVFPLLVAKSEMGRLSAGKGQAKLADQYPQLWAYLRRLEEEPGYKRAAAKMEQLEGRSKKS